MTAVLYEACALRSAATMTIGYYTHSRVVAARGSTTDRSPRPPGRPAHAPRPRPNLYGLKGNPYHITQLPLLVRLPRPRKARQAGCPQEDRHRHRGPSSRSSGHCCYRPLLVHRNHTDFSAIVDNGKRRPAALGTVSSRGSSSRARSRTSACSGPSDVDIEKYNQRSFGIVVLCVTALFVGFQSISRGLPAFRDLRRHHHRHPSPRAASSRRPIKPGDAR